MYIVYVNVAASDIEIREANEETIQSNENPNGWTYQNLAPSCHHSDMGVFNTMEEAKKLADEIFANWA